VSDRNEPPLLDSDGANDQMVTAERSMFGTRLPRPTGVGRHLVIVIVVSAVALAIAIAFAERSTPAAPEAPAPATR
jgi:hypothetical protein